MVAGTALFDLVPLLCQPVTNFQQPSTMHPRRILVDSGNYFSNNDNLGDRAIYQVIFSRLRQIWPSCEIHWITRNRVLLNDCCPHAIAIELKEEGRQPLPCSMERLGHSSEPVPIPGSDAARIMSALRDCDLVVATGGGYFTDDFAEQAQAVLDVLEAGVRLGKPAAILSCGFEPIRSRGLLEKMLRILPMLSLVVCREPRQSPLVAKSFGVSASRVVLAGDEAIELAFRARPTQLGNRLGINIRQADYAGVDAGTVSRLRDGLGQAIAQLRVPLVGTPISLSGPSDTEAIAALLAGIPDSDWTNPSVTTPQEVISKIGSCRVVVTGSYHAAVFALSQGVSVVAVVASSHYISKMQGLQAQFGAGCRIVFLDRDDTSSALTSAIENAWREAESVRPHLLQTAQELSALGRSAYQRLRNLGDDVPMDEPEAQDLPSTHSTSMPAAMTTETAALALSAEEIEKFRAQGYVGPFTAFEPHEMETVLATLRDRVLPTPTPYCPFGLRVRHLDSKTVYGLCAAPAIVERMASLYGPDLVLWNSNLFNKPPARPDLLEEYPWHQDHYNWNMEPVINISAWLAITPATEENGCVEIIPGSHRQIIPPMVDTDPAMSLRFGGIASDPSYVDATKKVSLVLKPGQFFLFNERLLHHSSPNRTDQHRLGLAVRVTVPIAKVSEPFPCVLLRGEDRMGFNRYVEAPTSEPDAHWVDSLPPGHDYAFDRPIPGRGWHVREKDGEHHFAWTGLEPEAWIDFRTVGAGDHVLRLEVAHMLAHDTVSEIQLSVNGQPLALSRQPGEGALLLETRVPEAVLRNRSDRVRVALHSPSLLRPCDLNPASTDKRKLGLGIRRITITPAGAVPAAVAAPR